MVGDADNPFPFPEDYFNTITMVASLEHFFDPYFILRECYRILKPEGTIIVQVPNLGFFPRRLSVLMGNLPVTSEDNHDWDGGHLYYFTVNLLKNLLEKEGFRIKTITCSGIFRSIRQYWVSLLGADIIIKANKH